jgi:hypothetical protein
VVESRTLGWTTGSIAAASIQGGRDPDTISPSAGGGRRTTESVVPNPPLSEGLSHSSHSVVRLVQPLDTHIGTASHPSSGYVPVLSADSLSPQLPPPLTTTQKRMIRPTNKLHLLHRKMACPQVCDRSTRTGHCANLARCCNSSSCLIFLFRTFVFFRCILVGQSEGAVVCWGGSREQVLPSFLSPPLFHLSSLKDTRVPLLLLP